MCVLRRASKRTRKGAGILRLGRRDGRVRDGRQSREDIAARVVLRVLRAVPQLGEQPAQTYSGGEQSRACNLTGA